MADRIPAARTLFLLRHAKSGWDDPVLCDVDRPLNAKGRRAAATVGRYLRAEGVAFDRVVASPAVRVRETLDALAQGLGRRLAPEWDRRLYLASLDTLVETVRALPAAAERVLLVGHNPGLEELALRLASAGEDPLLDAVADKYPTASLAELVLDRGWASVAPGAARLTRFVRPRDLDPALGPDRN